MLFLKRTMLLLILCSSAAVATAQHKTPVFQNFAASIDITESVLSNAITMAKGQPTQLNFGSELSFSGVVISNIQVFENLQTIIIKSPEFNNAVIQISKQILEDKSTAYVGRIFSEKSADGYQIIRTSNGAYSLQKFEAAVIKQDCAL